MEAAHADFQLAGGAHWSDELLINTLNLALPTCYNELRRLTMRSTHATFDAYVADQNPSSARPWRSWMAPCQKGSACTRLMQSA